MGNVRYVVPEHPPDDRRRPDGRAASTRRSSPRYAAGPEGDRAVLDGAKAMAMTIADLWLAPDASTLRGAFAAARAADCDRRRSGSAAASSGHAPYARRP